MRLTRVRIFGFKTFADKTEFTLDGGVIAVVGPNGCGKSNLVDAILWGLGEGNARQLRAATGQDVIFNGSSKRKPVGFAEVALTFDNEDRALPIDASEVVITRRLDRSGNSEYRINKQSCRLRDIYELLADSGLGRAGYSIVGQKEIDTALAASADDRRAWIDEAAGVQRYRARKQESLRRLAAANDHLSRVNDILSELESQREPLRAEAEQAARYKTLQASLREVEIGLLIRELATAVRELAELEQRIVQASATAVEESARAERLEEEVRVVGEAISELEVEMDSIRAVQQSSITLVERSEAAIQLAQEKLRSLATLEQSLVTGGEEAEARVRELEAEVEALTAEEARETADLAALRESMGATSSEAKALRAELEALDRRLVEARKAHAKQLAANAEAKHRAERRAAAQRELSGVQQSVPDLEAGRDEARSAWKELADRLNLARAALTELDGQIEGIRQAEKGQEGEVRAKLAERAALEGRRRGIEATLDSHEGVAQGARAVLDAVDAGQLPPHYVLVGEAVEAEKDLALAIETALGASANDLIVPADADAKRAIQWLKERRAGRCTFQPIPLMRPVTVGGDLRDLLGKAGIIGRASELVACAPENRPVVDSLLGRVVIVEDLDVALRHARTTGWSRMVTRDGEVVHGSGAVTGGQQSRSGYGLVQRKADLAEIEEQLAALDAALKRFDKLSQQRQRDLHEREAERESARTGMAPLEREVREAAEFLHSLEQELRGTEKQRARLLEEIQGLDRTSPTEAVDADPAAVEAERDEKLRELAGKTAHAEQSELALRQAEQRLFEATQRLTSARRRLQAAQDHRSSRDRKKDTLQPERDHLHAEIERLEKQREMAGAARDEAAARLAATGATRQAKLEESLRLAEEGKSARQNAAAVSLGAHQAEVARARAESRRATAEVRLLEDYGLLPEDALAQEGIHEVPDDAPAVVSRLRRDLRAMGDVNLGAIEAFERVDARVVELRAQVDDVQEGIGQIEASIRELDGLTRGKFVTTFEAVSVAFGELFTQMFGGGEGHLRMSDPDNVLESGVEIEVTLPGKKRQALGLLSGGERSLCATAFLFALLRVRPSPLVVLDEVDAPLDGRNVERFSEALVQFSQNTQFIVITHNPTTIERAPVWLGVTMQDPGVSTLVPNRDTTPRAAGEVTAPAPSVPATASS